MEVRSLLTLQSSLNEGEDLKIKFLERLRSRFAKPGASGQGSVFTKIGTADTKLAEARGRIIAVDAANAAKHADAATLEQEAVRVHREADAVNNRADAVLATL